MKRRLKRPGPTGTHTQGKIHEDDQGDLRLRIAPDKAKGVILVDFGKRIAWMGIGPAEARAIAGQLLAAAAALTTTCT